MRILIVFLFFSYFNIFTAIALENEALIIGAHQSVKKSNPVLGKAITFSNKENHAIGTEPFAVHLDRIHQNTNRHNIATVLGFADCSGSSLYIPIKSANLIRTKVNYSYPFIFNCLYPKHTFW